MKNIIYITILLFWGSSVQSQDFINDIKKMNAVYQNSPAFSCKMNIKVFANNQLFTTKKAKINKQQNNYLYSLDSKTMLLNNQYFLMVDGENKVIVMNEVDEQSVKEKTELNQLVFKDLDSLLNQYQNWEFLGSKDGKKSYLFTIPNGMIKRVKLTLNNSNYSIRELIYYYDEGAESKNRVAITFSNVSLHPQFAKNFFSEKKFLRKLENKWTTKGKYKNYELIHANQNL